MKISNSVTGLVIYLAVGFFYYLICLKLGFANLSSEVRSLDSVILDCAKFSAVSTIVFLIGHLLFRKLQTISRAFYSLTGAFAFLVAMWILIPQSSIDTLVVSGLVTLGVTPPLLVGIMAGFLYHRFAGIAYEISDVDELAGFTTGEEGETQGEALIKSSSAEFYDGPLQVKTSFGALLIASIFGLIVYDIAGLLGLVIPELIALIGGGTTSQPLFKDSESLVSHLNFALIDGLLDKIIFFIPYGFVILVCHLAARGLNRHSYRSYLAISLAIPTVLALVVYPIPGAAKFIGFSFVIPMAIGALLYRSLAGVEPKSLPEDVIVSDKRALVGKDHALRKYRRVVPSS